MHQELFIDGVWLPSVTTITSAAEKPWLKAWKEKWGALAERKMLIANAIGTEFHRCIESWLNTLSYIVKPPSIENYTMPSLVPRVEGMMASWLVWARSFDGEVLSTELQVISKKHLYSGTLDAVITVGNKLFVVDWKTSSRIYNEMQLQLTAYAQAYNEQYVDIPKLSVKDGIIVHVSKEKPHFKLSIREFKLGKRPFKEFLKLRKMFDMTQIQGGTMTLPSRGEE